MKHMKRCDQLNYMQSLESDKILYPISVTIFVVNRR